MKTKKEITQQEMMEKGYLTSQENATKIESIIQKAIEKRRNRVQRVL